MRIVFWQNFQNALQSAMIRALADIVSTVVLVTQDDLPDWRRECGWDIPDFGKTRLVVSPTNSVVSSLLKEREQESIHIFSASRVDPLVWQAFRECLSTKAKIGIYSEAYVWNEPKVVLRLIRGWWDTFLYESRCNFLLAIGEMGMRWFRMSGYPDHKLYQFGYFVEKPSNQESDTVQFKQRDGNRVEMVFIGQCIRRKGIDLLLKALGNLKHLNWNLQIIGDGEKKKEFESLALQLGLSERIHFLGALKNAEARLIMKNSDLFVLPSRWDGWGAVVNEALMEGVPVVCSNLCGSADLLSNPERGETFPSGSINILREILARRIAQGKRTAELTGKIKEWSEKIRGETVAGYLLDVIDASTCGKSKPFPPWLR
jgi:glycosyltransferase involved in cell wall biosynthesis